ncbi:MAG: hypothetical protein U9O98_07695 [Asgard group archaeon]|nr:hypothetical protein [Asgard group archaeon]
MNVKFLSDQEVEDKIHNFLKEHQYNFETAVKVEKRLKPVDFAVKTSDRYTAVMLFLWKRSLPYDKVYYVEEYMKKFGFDKIIIVCRQISPRAKEIIKNNDLPIDIVFESDFRTMKESPLIGKL